MATEETPKGYTPGITYIQAQGPVWQTRMGLEHFEVRHVFVDRLYDDEPVVTAITECRWQYLTADITWYLPSVARCTDERLEAILVHEYAHILLAPEQEVLDQILERERVTKGLEDHEWLALQDAYAKVMELSTEMCARAVLGAYHHRPSGRGRR